MWLDFKNDYSANMGFVKYMKYKESKWKEIA